MRFSIHTAIQSPSVVVQRATQIESLGYEAMFVADSQMNVMDPFQALTLAAVNTRRIKLGTAVTNMVYRDPTVLAGSAASLNGIAEGRFVLGLGTGDGPVYTLGRMPTPVKQFHEGLKLMRELLNGRPGRFPPGEVSLTQGKTPVPIYLSVEGPKGLHIAGMVADGVILGSGFDLRVTAWAREKIAAGAREAGRSPDEIDLIAAGMICLDPDGEKARTTVRTRMANRAHHNFRFTLETVPPEELPGLQKFMDNFDDSRPLEEKVDPKFVTDYLVQRFSIAGTPQECIARVKELQKAGIKHLMLTPPGKVYSETVEAWAKQVMPQFTAG